MTEIKTSIENQYSLIQLTPVLIVDINSPLKLFEKMMKYFFIAILAIQALGSLQIFACISNSENINELIDIFFNCFNSLTFYLILFIGLYDYFKNSYGSNKAEKEETTDSFEQRSNNCLQQYPNGWLPVYQSQDLKKREVKPIFALGRDLIIYRGTSGKVYVFDAYCPHLGANLGVGGTVVGDDVKCHFHGWSFNNQGDCIGIPGLEVKSIPKANIRKYRCDEVNDLIYVWHHLEGKEPDWFMPKLEKIETMIHRGHIIVKVNCHVQDILENEADVIHLDTIHGKTKIFPKVIQNLINFELIPKFWKVCDPPNTFSTQMAVDGNFGIGCLNSRISLDIRATGPAHLSVYMYSDTGIMPSFFSTTNVITLGKSKQAFVFKWYTEPTIPGFIFSKFFSLFIGYFLDGDFLIWNNKSFVRSPVFTKLDETIIGFRRWYKQFYSNHPNND